MMGEKLQAITDTEDGQSHGQDARVRDGRVRVVDRAGASGEYQSDGVMGADLGQRSGTGKDHREDVLFAYAPGYELGVLAAKIKDDNRGGIHVVFFRVSLSEQGQKAQSRRDG